MMRGSVRREKWKVGFSYQEGRSQILEQQRLKETHNEIIGP